MTINLDEATSGAFHQLYDHQIGWDADYLSDWAENAAQAISTDDEWLPWGVTKAEILRRACDELLVEQMASARRDGQSWRAIARCVGRHHSSVQRWAISHGVEERAEQMREHQRAWLARHP